jgi:peptide/nickel transport system permease protein
MGRYIAKRLLLAIPTLLIVSLTVSALIRLIPGDVVTLMVGENQYGGNPDELRHLLGTDRPFLVQYATWIGGVLRGDFGDSLWSGRSALEEFRHRMPVTLELGLLTIALSAAVSIPVGVLAAVRQDSFLDYSARMYVMLGLSVPGFWLATLLIVLGSIWFKWTPELVYVPLWKDPFHNLRQFLPPILLLGAFGSATVMRLTRATVLEVLRQEYVRTARAKGLAGYAVLIRHVLRNALIPILTLVGLQIPVVIGGSIVMEQIFGLPGMGRFTLETIQRRDYPMLQAINLFFAAVVVLSNLLVDVLYGMLDPRIRLA